MLSASNLERAAASSSVKPASVNSGNCSAEILLEEENKGTKQ